MQGNHNNPTLTKIICVLIALTINCVPVRAFADRCQEMEQEGLLLYQQFKSGKVCKAAGKKRNVTDCLFRTGGTEILLVGATGTRREERMFGTAGSGFHILSLDPTVTLSLFADKDFCLVVRVQEKRHLKETGCASNEAYITLDGQVLSPDDMSQIKHATPHQATSPEDRIKYVQENLILLGYRIGKADGMLGRQTRTAIESYKRDRHLEKDLPDEDVFQKITEDAYLKILDELKRLTSGMVKP